MYKTKKSILNIFKIIIEIIIEVLNSINSTLKFRKIIVLLLFV